jgi:magnesium chelatase family protein
MTTKLLKAHVPLTDESRGLLETSMDQMNFSARAHDRILKVARTIADLAESPDVTPDHLLEAVNFRTLDRNYWV